MEGGQGVNAETGVGISSTVFAPVGEELRLRFGKGEDW